MGDRDQRPRLFLVDGHGLAYRSLYALIDRPLMTSRGESTSLAWGATQFIRKLLAEQAPEYLVFVFDATRGKSFRHQMYPLYKATRQKGDDDERADFANGMRRLRALLEAFRIPTIEVEGFEADDVIATLATTAAARGLDAVIVSGDTDFYQLIGPRIRVLEPGRGGRALIAPEWIDAARAEERFGVPPEKVRDYLALCGDASDNVPGIPGIGHKTALALITRFGSLEEMLARSDEIVPARARSAILEHADQARLAKTLVTVLTDLPVELDLPALASAEPDLPKLRALFVELEFRSLLAEVAGLAENDRDQVEPRRLASVEDARAFAWAARAKGRIAIEAIARDAAARLHETEDRQDVVMRRSPGRPGAAPEGFGLATEVGAAAYLPLNGDEGGGPIAEILAAPEVLKIGHDLKRSILLSKRAGLAVEGPIFDVMLAAFALEGGPRPRDLETQVVEALGHALPPADGAGGAARAEAMIQLYDRLDPELDARNLRQAFVQIDMPLVFVLADMERAGIAIDRAFLEALDQRLTGAAARLERELYEDAGGELNLESPAQLKKVLFEKLGLPVKKRTKTGPSADAEVLAELAGEGHAFPRKLLEHRELCRVLKTFVRAIPALADQATGRIHPSFAQGTPSGRISSADPSFEALFVHPEFAKEVLRGFIAANERLLLSARYARLERAILAEVSTEPEALTAEHPGSLPKVQAFAERQTASARERGYVETLFRRRAIPEVASKNPRIRAYGDELAQTISIEVSAGDVIKRALIDLHSALHAGRHASQIVAQAGDQILLEVPNEELEPVTALVRHAMTSATTAEVPLEVEIGAAPNWSDANRPRI